MVVHRKKIIHTQNHFSEQVVIELVFEKFLSYEKSWWILNYSSMYISNEKKNITLIGRKPPPFFTFFNFSSDIHNKFHSTLPRINHIRRYEKNITHDDDRLSTKTTRDHGNRRRLWGKELIRRHCVLYFIFDRWCVMIYVSFIEFNLGYYVFERDYILQHILTSFRIHSSKIFTL